MSVCAIAALCVVVVNMICSSECVVVKEGRVGRWLVASSQSLYGFLPRVAVPMMLR